MGSWGPGIEENDCAGDGVHALDDYIDFIQKRASSDSNKGAKAVHMAIEHCRLWYDFQQNDPLKENNWYDGGFVHGVLGIISHAIDENWAIYNADIQMARKMAVFCREKPDGWKDEEKRKEALTKFIKRIEKYDYKIC